MQRKELVILGAGAAAVGLIGATFCPGPKPAADDDDDVGAIEPISMDKAMRIRLHDRFEACARYDRQVSRFEAAELSKSDATEIKSLLEEVFRELTKVDGTQLLPYGDQEQAESMRMVRKEAVNLLKGLESRLLVLDEKVENLS
ncbi:hypothetical protein DIPPA_24959 [Diplonema papillatum]|nr:hypothetical protein DIPPA_24959 [Diplonema papillatum]